jgi:HSP20 family protein
MEIAMNTIIRFDPFENTMFPEFFKGLNLARNMPWPVEFGGDFKVDLSETDKEYLVAAELPGVPKENIHIAVDGDLLTISAEVVSKVESKTERLVRSERFIGNLRRSFSLGVDVDPEKVVARYENGVLFQNLPKKVPGSVKRIMVS